MATFKHVYSDEIKVVPEGFSWTILFFGFLVPMFRGDFIGAAVLLTCSVFTRGASNILFAFLYNDYYISSLQSDGYQRVNNGHDTQ